MSWLRRRRSETGGGCWAHRTKSHWPELRSAHKSRTTGAEGRTKTRAARLRTTKASGRTKTRASRAAAKAGASRAKLWTTGADGGTKTWTARLRTTKASGRTKTRAYRAADEAGTARAKLRTTGASGGIKTWAAWLRTTAKAGATWTKTWATRLRHARTTDKAWSGGARLGTTGRPLRIARSEELPPFSDQSGIKRNTARPDGLLSGLRRHRPRLGGLGYRRITGFSACGRLPLCSGGISYSRRGGRSLGRGRLPPCSGGISYSRRGGRSLGRGRLPRPLEGRITCGNRIRRQCCLG